MSNLPFSCRCGEIKGIVKAVPGGGIHLQCYCDSCRAGANYCGADHSAGTPVDLYLTPTQHVEITQGRERLTPFVFSPKGVVRWQAECCGVQMFSSQRNPKIAFMSLSTDTFEEAGKVGPVVTKAFVPKSNGKTGHEGIGPLMRLILAAAISRLTGAWRKTQLYDLATLKPFKPAILVSREEKRALLKSS